jgi:DNA-binding response OmpR family regulator
MENRMTILADANTKMRTVLVVEDDPDARQLAATALGMDGFSVIEVGDALAALDALQGHHIDAVVLDLTLPGTHGLDLLAAIRRTSDVPVVIVSANEDVNTRIVGLRVGADDFLVKPVNPGEMTARISAVLRRAQPKVASYALNFGELAIDRDARQAFLRGELIDLAPKELDLLLFLASHPRRAFSRAQLLEEVWRSSTDWQQASTVTEHIRKLRAKLESDAARPRWISTVRNVGYRFDP